MSMREYAFDDYGLLMTDNMLKMIASKVFEDYTEEDYDDDPWSFDYDLYEKGIVEYVSNFTGEAFNIDDNGCNGFGRIISDDVIYYVPMSKISTLFKAAYKDMDEIVDEFKKKLSNFFPDDFDYAAHICHIVGTYYG